MKLTGLLAILFLYSCNSDEQAVTKSQNSETTVPPDTHKIVLNIKTDSLKTNESKPVDQVYANQRFKDVVIKHLGNNKFRITGKGQIFEANFNWVLEDGHEELQKGFTMTDAGAPEWGNFDFTIHAKKKRGNSTLHLIIFESSAKDGSRQHELPILLY
ncbi:MAG: Gmad2 immunoglobulin-like domain-containing protein [Bacteroidota bacterium]|nr:Gmad2 immunoglobulin-like domain-containing protein [Bacteroidota bacterium]